MINGSNPSKEETEGHIEIIKTRLHNIVKVAVHRTKESEEKFKECLHVISEDLTAHEQVSE